MNTLSGPMFEQPETEFWKSTHGKMGAHYNLYSTKDKLGMEALRDMFPNGKADELNFCLFSTSGVHGTYQTIEESIMSFNGEADEDGYIGTTDITFLIIHPRVCCLRYGNCIPQTEDDYDFLIKLRQSSWDIIKSIGK